MSEDKQIWLFITGATTAVMFLIAALVITVGISVSWVLLPTAWFIGAAMTWGYEKIITIRA